MNNILVTGGAGFIGSHVVDMLIAQFPDARITILDKLTYAADYENIAAVLDRKKRRFIVGDICDLELCRKLTRDIDVVIHTAAESHVDNAFTNSLQFTLTNAVGTHTLLEASRQNSVGLFIHVGTDEVYGEIADGRFSEDSRLNPSNPYSASKAAADMIANCYFYSFKLPIIIVRSNNIFGKRQFPEKIIPKFTMQALNNMPMTLHGDGTHIRHYLSAGDFASGILTLLSKGKAGKIYNIGSNESYQNIEIAKWICNILGRDIDQTLAFVDDRPFNDSRYAVDSTRIRELGWQPRQTLTDELPEIVSWYSEHRDRYEHIIAGNHADGTLTESLPRSTGLGGRR